MYVLKLYLHIRYYNILIMLLDKNVHAISPNQIINFMFVLIVFFNIKDMFYTPKIPTGADLEWKQICTPDSSSTQINTLHIIMR